MPVRISMRKAIVAAVCLPLLCGCAGGFFGEKTRQAEREEMQAKAEAADAELAKKSADAAVTPASTASAKTVEKTANSAQSMQEVMNELRQIGDIDPASQNKLLEDLRQTDPALWPMMVSQYRAATAYRKRAEQREKQEKAEIVAAGATKPIAKAVKKAVEEESIEEDADVTPIETTVRAESDDDTPPAKLKSAKNKKTKKKATPDGDVTPASYETDAKPNAASSKLKTLAAAEKMAAESDDAPWQEHFSKAINGLEKEASGQPKTAEELASQAKLRMMYALAGRRDDAMKPIASAPPALQDYWVKQTYGISTMLDTQKNADGMQRAAESKRALDEAAMRLGVTAPLVIRNLTFCTAVQSYGCYTPFKKYEFSPDDEALLYAEVENFGSEATPKGFHTVLRSSYQILDSGGHRVAEHTFANTEEYCQNPRRDFFIGYHLRMPTRINPGRYTLQLTIEDLNSQKVGQSTIELTVKEAPTESDKPPKAGQGRG